MNLRKILIKWQDNDTKLEMKIHAKLELNNEKSIQWY